MQLCNEDHAEICYEGRVCPACNIREDLNSEIKDLEDSVTQKDIEIRDLESQVSDLQDQIQESNEARE